MENEKKITNDHYVPQFYLKGFAPDNSDIVKVFNIKNGSSFPSNVKNICSEKGFYGTKVEEFLSELSEKGFCGKKVEEFLSDLETGCKKAIGYIEQNEMLPEKPSKEGDDEMFTHLMQFIGIQTIRTKKHFEWIKSLAEVIGSHKTHGKNFTFEEYCKPLFDYKITNQSKEANLFIVNLVLRKWTLFKINNNSNLEFCTTDNPVTWLYTQNFINAKNLTEEEQKSVNTMSMGTMVIFPISKKLLAYGEMSYHDSEPDVVNWLEELKNKNAYGSMEKGETHILTDDQVNQVKELNAIISSNATRFIINPQV